MASCLQVIIRVAPDSSPIMGPLKSRKRTRHPAPNKLETEKKGTLWGGVVQGEVGEAGWDASLCIPVMPGMHRDAPGTHEMCLGYRDVQACMGCAGTHRKVPGTQGMHGMWHASPHPTPPHSTPCYCTPPHHSSPLIVIVHHLSSLVVICHIPSCVITCYHVL